MVTHYEGRGGHTQLFDTCVIVQIDEINEVEYELTVKSVV